MQISQFLPRISILKACGKYEKLFRRSIYTAEQLSVANYVKDRDQLKKTFQTSYTEKKKMRLQKYLDESNISSYLFVNNFSEFLHLIDNTDDDFALLEKALNTLKRINVENLRKANIGIILMKMLYHFKRDDFAKKIYNDAILQQNFLRGRHSNVIYFNLLYQQNKFEDLLQQFDELRNRLASNQQFVSRSIYTLVFATCYRQNTTKSFEYGMQLHNQFSDSHITQDHLIFLSALALDQNAPDVTINLLSNLWPTAHEAIASLQLSALVQMRRFVDSLQLLSATMGAFDNNNTTKSDPIAVEVIEKAEQIFQKFCDDERLRNDFQHLRSNLNHHGYIVDKKLTTMVFEPFKMTHMTRQQTNRMYLQAEFDRKIS